MSRRDQMLATIKPDVIGWIAQLTGQVTGTAFPDDQEPGLRCFRTDRGIEYYWDGERWLSTQLHPVVISGPRITMPFTTGTYYGGMPIRPSMFLTSLMIRAAPTGTHESMHYWRMRFRTYGATTPGMVVWDTCTGYFTDPWPIDGRTRNVARTALVHLP
jgi:hypothetical protein